MPNDSELFCDIQTIYYYCTKVKALGISLEKTFEMRFIKVKCSLILYIYNNKLYFHYYEKMGISIHKIL